MVDLSIVIVSYNVRDLLAACLDSVFAEIARLAPRTVEVFVVDNASADGSAAMVAERFPQVRLIVNSDNRGFAAANNQALRESHGRCVVLLNPDTLVRPEALGTLLDFLDANPRVGVIGPRLVNPDGSFQHSAFGFPTLAQAFFDFFPIHHRLFDSRLNGRYPRRLYERGQPFCVDHPLGACLMARREALEQVGWLDEGFFIYCEEIDWCLRMKQAGWGVYCVPQAEVVHYVAQSTCQFRGEMFVALWRSRYRLFAKHYGRGFISAMRQIVRLGLWCEARRARGQAARGEIGAVELAKRLEAYRQVAAM
jgi:GT2 family glycosyltransferase